MANGAETKVAAAVESVAASEVAQAEAATDNAQSVAVAALSNATENTVAAAETATALANANAAVAVQQATETINVVKDDNAWLKTNQESQGALLQNLASRQEQQEVKQNQAMEVLTGISGMLQSLTRQQSTTAEEPTLTVVSPAKELNEDANRAGTKVETAAKAVAKKAKRWI